MPAAHATETVPAPPAIVHPAVEIRRLQDDVDRFDREIGQYAARVARHHAATDRIYLSAIRAAREVTLQALDIWLDRCAAGAELDHDPARGTTPACA